MKRPLHSALVLGGAALLAAILFLALLDLAVMPSLVKVDRVRVPQVRGLTVKQAQQRLQQSGLNVTIADSVYHESLPAGSVAEQDPAPSQLVKRGRRVMLEVSTGPHFYVVPAGVVGSSEREARLQLQANHLAVGEVTLASSASVPEGVVARSSPRPGTSLTRGARVDLVVSNGSPTIPKPVPALVGLSIQVVEDTLRKYEMRLGSIANQVSNDYPMGTVLSQTPGASQRVPPLTTVSIVVSVQDTSTAPPGELPGEPPGEPTGQEGQQ